MISHRYRCIYVKVPKCASTAVRDWFLAHGGGRHSFSPSWYPGPMAHRIQSVGRVLELYPDYFTFSFVRNPYRRFVSVYRHASRLAEARARRIPGHPASYGNLSEFAQLCEELLADARGLWGRRAGAFLREQAGCRYGPLGIRLRHLRFVADHARPQVDFLPDCQPARLFGVRRAGGRPLDFIGAVESVGADFTRLQERLGLPRVPLSRANASAPAASGDGMTRLDAATRRRLERIYADDFDFTGCSARAAPLPADAAPHPPRRPATLALADARRPTGGHWRRLVLSLRSLEIGVEDRLRRLSVARRLFAPLARLRRRLARSEPARESLSRL